MDNFDIPTELPRLFEGFVFASPEPVTPKTLEPLLPGDLDSYACENALNVDPSQSSLIILKSLEKIELGWGHSSREE